MTKSSPDQDKERRVQLASSALDHNTHWNFMELIDSKITHHVRTSKIFYLNSD
jgi:hypothetical protein